MAQSLRISDSHKLLLFRILPLLAHRGVRCRQSLLQNRQSSVCVVESVLFCREHLLLIGDKPARASQARTIEPEEVWLPYRRHLRAYLMACVSRWNDSDHSLG